MAETKQIRLREGTAAEWTSADPTLLSGEMGVEADTKKFKVGDGSTAWTSLAYWAYPPIGTIIAYGGTSAPSGYLACDGSAVSRTTYADLFSAIGTTWGVGDGSTTFNVPDLRGAYLRGAGSHGSETMADGNPYAGPAVGAFEDDQMQGHIHFSGAGTRAPGEPGVYGSTTDDIPGMTDNYYGHSTGNVATKHAITSDPKEDASNDTPRTGDETRPFAAGVLYCIKT